MFKQRNFVQGRTPKGKLPQQQVNSIYHHDAIFGDYELHSAEGRNGGRAVKTERHDGNNASVALELGESCILQGSNTIAAMIPPPAPD